MSILDKIYAQRREDVEAAKKERSLEELEQQAQTYGTPKNLYEHIKASLDADKKTKSVLAAEIKRASPSKGDIAPDCNVTEQALLYANGGAAIISILTEPKWFKGTLDDMKAIRKLTNEKLGEQRPAILRKDFVLDTYQVTEALAYGADTLLLIVKMLEDASISELIAECRRYGMEPLVEVQNVEEMKRAVALGAKVIGVNNRNLHTFEVDLNTTKNLMSLVPPGTFVLSLSGISTRADVAEAEEAGIHGVLVGESLMRVANAGKKIQQLLGKVSEKGGDNVHVKICGVRTKEAAVKAVESGAGMVGMIFVPGTKRCVSVDTAKEIVQHVRTTVPRASGHKGVRDYPGRPSRDEKDGKTWFTKWSNALSREMHVAPPLFVGVFQNQTADEINSIVREVNLDMVQFHGGESDEMANSIERPVVRAVHVAANDTVDSLKQRIVPGHYALILLDTKVPNTAHSGGSGQTFDWKLAEELAKEYPIMMAGGIVPDNVGSAVKQCVPYAVDVSSGVETDGQKDLGKVEAFVKNALSAATDAGA
eukprot:Clim_evm46s156 gene=Clim_evmTU46s156